MRTADRDPARPASAEELQTELDAAHEQIARLSHDTKEAIAHQTAISDVLKAMTRSPYALDELLQATIDHGTKLCRAEDGLVYLKGGGELHLRTGNAGGPAEGKAYEVAHPTPIDRGSAAGRAAADAKTVHITDVLADPDYRWFGGQEIVGYRTLLAVPIRRAGETLGVIAFSRHAVLPFSDREIALVETFADQAAIAIENVRLFEELQAQGDALAVANRHKSEFLANMSHELRTPLNAVIGFSDVLLQRMVGEINPKQSEYLEDIRSSGQHLLSLINDILDLSKVEAGKMDLELSRFSLDDALQGVVMMVRERAAGRGVELHIQVEPDLEPVEADERKIKQVVLNLLTNAVKFTPAGGRVALRASRDGDQIVLTITDTGIGIAAADQARVFEEFAQARGGAAGSQEGTGLGLALSRKFVELHRGSISIESELGKGSVFTVTLPVATQPR